VSPVLVEIGVCQEDVAEKKQHGDQRGSTRIIGAEWVLMPQLGSVICATGG
jgi:hypothetical protein